MTLESASIDSMEPVELETKRPDGHNDPDNSWMIIDTNYIPETSGGTK